MFFDSDEDANYEKTGISKRSVPLVQGELDLAAMAEASSPMNRGLIDEALANADFQRHEFAIRPLKENAFSIKAENDIIPSNLAHADIDSMNQDLATALFKDE